MVTEPDVYPLPDMLDIAANAAGAIDFFMRLVEGPAPASGHPAHA
jgi:hypothetical protein